MAAKGAREPITLECTECKRRNYMTSKNITSSNSMRDELKKVTWPTRKELVNSTMAVIVIVVINTIVTTAIVLLTNCFGVGQITFFSSALKSLKKCFFTLLSFLLSLLSFLAILFPP